MKIITISILKFIRIYASDQCTKGTKCPHRFRVLTLLFKNVYLIVEFECSIMKLFMII